MPENGSKLTLEELLAAKRAERPSEAFWIRFDKELDYKRRRLLQSQIVDESAFKTLVGRRVSRYAAVSCTLGCSAFAVVVALNLSIFEPSAKPAAPIAEKQSSPVAVAAMEDVSIRDVGLREFSTLAAAHQPRLIVAQVRRPEAIAVALETRAVSENAPRSTGAVSSAIARATATPEIASYASDWFNPLAIDAAREPAANAIIGEGFDEKIALGKYANPLRAYGGSDRMRHTPVLTSQRDSSAAIDEFLNSRGSSSSTERSLDALTLRF